MNRFIPFALALGFLLFAAPALATDTAWILGCNNNGSGVLATSPTTNRLLPGQVACYQGDAATDDSEVLDVGQCETIMVSQWDDADADAAASQLTGTIEWCPFNEFNSGCDPLAVTAIGSGNARKAGLRTSRYMVMTLNGTGGNVATYEVKCEGAGRR